MCDGSARGRLGSDTDGLAGDGGTSVGNGDECLSVTGWPMHGKQTRIENCK